MKGVNHRPLVATAAVSISQLLANAEAKARVGDGGGGVVVGGVSDGVKR